MTIAEEFYEALPVVDSNSELLELMDHIMNTSVIFEIQGTNTIFFAFEDRSWLRTEIEGARLSSWHGIIAAKSKLH